MKNKILKLSFLLIFLFVTIGISSNFCKCYAQSSKVETSAKSMIVMETLHDKVLYSKNENTQLPMASTTKIVTAITVIENCDDLDALVTIPKGATLAEGSSIYLRANEQLTIRQLLYGLMLQSGNDAAETLALELGNGSLENFAELMNQTAKNCGAENSNFVTPHGLDDKEHYTTAYDLAKITSYALKNPVFKEIVSCKKYIIPATEHNTARTLLNKNKLLSSLDGCDGVKTGYTKKSGRCLVSSCTRNGMQVVCVVLNCGPMFEDSTNLINKAFEEYKLYEILPSYKFVDDVVVECSIDDIDCNVLPQENAFFEILTKDIAEYVKKFDADFWSEEYDTTLCAQINKSDYLSTYKYVAVTKYEDSEVLVQEESSAILNSLIKRSLISKDHEWLTSENNACAA